MKKSTKIMIVIAAVVGFLAALCAVWAFSESGTRRGVTRP